MPVICIRPGVYSQKIIIYFSKCTGQRRRQADEAKDNPPLRTSFQGDMISRITSFMIEDKRTSDQDALVAGNIQMIEVCEGLFVIYNHAAINLYLTWNQKFPLMIDATGLRIKSWNGKSHW